MTDSEWGQGLVAMLVMPLRQLERVRHWAPRIRVGVAVFIALVYIITWLVAAYNLWQAVDARSFSTFWAAYDRHVTFGFSLIPVGFLGGILVSMVDQALAIRRAVAIGDERVAPVAPGQPLPLSTDEMPKGPVQFVSLVRPERSPARRQQIIPGILFFILGAVFAAFTALAFGLGSDLAVLGPWFAVMVLIFVAMTLGGIAMGVLMLLWARRSLSRLNLTADEWGLAWDSARLRRRRMQIAWHEARAFFRATPGRLATANARTIYVLDGGDAVLAWALPSSATPAEHAASERLSRLIVTRTRLPLRSVALDPLHAVPTPEELATERKPPDPAIAPTVPVSAWRILLLNPSCLGVLAVLAVLAFSGLLGLAGLALQHVP